MTPKKVMAPSLKKAQETCQMMALNMDIGNRARSRSLSSGIKSPRRFYSSRAMPEMGRGVRLAHGLPIPEMEEEEEEESEDKPEEGSRKKKEKKEVQKPQARDGSSQRRTRP